MNSEELRTSPTLLRNEYPVSPMGMPIITSQSVPHLTTMLAYHDVCENDEAARNSDILVHFFKNDTLFESLYERPYSRQSVRKLKQLAQYSAVCTPDFSLYPEMPYPVQVKQVFKNRWCGAHWQSLGLCVIPTISWADAKSFSFCFDGILRGSAVVVSTVGCKQYKNQFLAGYDKMLEVLQPHTIFCYGNPFCEMSGNIICFPYTAFRKKVST